MKCLGLARAIVLGTRVNQRVDSNTQERCQLDSISMRCARRAIGARAAARQESLDERETFGNERKTTSPRTKDDNECSPSPSSSR